MTNESNPARQRPGRFPSLAAVAAAAAICTAPAAFADGVFSFDDVHYWVGEGTNRAVVVVDWNDGPGTALAWGYRWDGGGVSAARAISDIAHEDSRLHYVSSQSQWGTSVDGFGYDVADVAAAFDPACATSSDAAALAAAYAGPFYWAQSVGAGDDAGSVKWDYGSGVDFDTLSDGAWYGFKKTNWMTWEDSTPSREVVAAESPYAWRVVDSFLQDEEDNSYWLDGVLYSNVTRRVPATALGRPSLHVSGYGDVPDHPATPAEQAWGDDQIVKLVAPDDSDDEACGYVTVEFDHDVVDDPCNPFGLDFIVFSYRFVYVTGGYYATQDPGSVKPSTSSLYAPRGRVEVSADGDKWFEAGEIGSDSFAPGLSRVYDTETPDSGAWESDTYANGWWGATTDATRPFDPSIRLSDFAGATLARICELYDGSAGGTGFDISGLALPTDAQGRKFFRFVRVSAVDPGDEISIDAISDVSPAPSFRNWVDANFAFADRPGVAKTDENAAGLPLGALAAFGLPKEASSLPAGWGVGAFDPAALDFTAAVPFAPHAWDLVTLRSSPSVDAPRASWSATVPLWTGEDGEGRQVLRAQGPAASTGSAGFFRFDLGL